MTPSTRQDIPAPDPRSRYRPTPATPGRGADRPAPTTATSEEARPWSPPNPSGHPPAPPPTSPSHPKNAGRPDDSGDPLVQLPQVLTVREVAAILRVGRNQLYEAVARGELPAVRIGRTIRIPTTALRDLLAAPAHQSGGTASSR
jgi:excisionase family DNA binding protein